MMASIKKTADATLQTIPAMPSPVLPLAKPPIVIPMPINRNKIVPSRYHHLLLLETVMINPDIGHLLRLLLPRYPTLHARIVVQARYAGDKAK